MGFNKSTKNTIDLIAPSLVAGYVGYYFFTKKSKDWKEIAIPTVITFVLAYFIVSQITKAVLNKVSSPTNLSGAIDTPTPIDSGSGDVTGAGFNPQPWTDRLFKDIDCIICLRDGDLYKQVATFSNAQLQSIYNDWNERYFNEDSETLTQAMDGEYYGFSDLTLKGYAESIKSRLRALGAN